MKYKFYLINRILIKKMRSNYTERVARLFEYPYSTGFDTSVNKLNVSEKDRFMQSLLSYQRINPFHYDCK